MKIVDVYGIEMTSIQEMKFSQFLNRGDSPAKKWLADQNQEQK